MSIKLHFQNSFDSTYYKLFVLNKYYLPSVKGGKLLLRYDEGCCGGSDSGGLWWWWWWCASAADDETGSTGSCSGSDDSSGCSSGDGRGYVVVGVVGAVGRLGRGRPTHNVAGLCLPFLMIHQHRQSAADYYTSANVNVEEMRLDYTH